MRENPTCSRNFIPDGDLGPGGAEIIDLRQERLNMRVSEMSVQVGEGNPIFVKNKLAGVFLKNMEIVIQATFLFARGRDQGDERFAESLFLARGGLERSDDGNDFNAHSG